MNKKVRFDLQRFADNEFLTPMHVAREALMVLKNNTVMSQLVFTANMKGIWKSALHGTVYDYGYPLNDVLQVKLYADGNYKINYSMGAKAP